MGKYFGTDGVRGVANSELTPELAFKLGRIGGFILTKGAATADKAKVLIGRDTRFLVICLKVHLLQDFFRLE